MKINNEAKARRSTRPVVLGIVVVIGHDELKAAWTKCNKKDATKDAKGKAKQCRKRKNAPEADDDETELPKPKAKRAKDSRELEVGISEICEPDRVEPGSVR